jgi:hypothetical protein
MLSGFGFFNGMKSSKAKRVFMRFCVLLVCVLTLGLHGLPVLMAEERLTPAETFVLKELRSGRTADLGERAVNDRFLGHDFVEKLLTDGYPNYVIAIKGVTIKGATFQQKLDVSGANVPFRVWLENCTFQHGIDFSDTKFAQDLSLEGSQFGIASKSGPPSREDDGAYFVGMKVDGTSNFKNSTFYIPVDFTYAEIGSDFVFDDAKYLRVDEPADFESTKFKGWVSFNRVAIAATINLNDAELQKLIVEDSVSLDIDLTRARIERDLLINNVQLNSWNARFLVIDGEAKLDNVIPSGPVDLTHAHVGSLVINGFNKWLELKPGTLKLDGFSFDGLDFDVNSNKTNTNNAPRMLDLLNSKSCPYTPQAYLELEKYFRANGNPEMADNVYVNMRQRQRNELVWFNRPWDWLLDTMLGYGRKTWRAAFCALAFTVLGIIVFAPNRMEWKDTKQPQRRYSRFWYSLDQLAPVMDLDVAKNWGPRQNDSWMQNYALFHRIVGWILLPLIIGAITGIVK